MQTGSATRLTERCVRAILAVLLAALALPTISSAVGAQEDAPGEQPGIAVRIVAQRVADGRTEFALQQRRADDTWGERLLPAQRFFPAAARAGRWLVSTPVSLSVETAAGEVPATGVEVRIVARRGSDQRIEFALQRRKADESWGERLLPSQRFFPAAARVGRWLVSTPLTVPVPLSVTVDSPGWCLGSEGALGPGGRRGFGSVDVTYAVSGGVGPYTITSPDAPGAVHNAPSGAITVSCARDGRDPAPVSLDVNLVEAGPRTIRVEVTDSVGATTYADLVIEVAENAYTSEYNGGIMCAGRTYILGDPDPGDWVLITLPPALYLRFAGLSPTHGSTMAHFEEITTGSEIVLDWNTGEEIWRNIRSEEIDGTEEIIAAGCPESTS